MGQLRRLTLGVSGGYSEKCYGRSWAHRMFLSSEYFRCNDIVTPLNPDLYQRITVSFFPGQ